MSTAWMPTLGAKHESVEDPSTVAELLAGLAVGYDEPVRSEIIPSYGLAVCECGASARGERWIMMQTVPGLRSVVFADGGDPPCEHWEVDTIRGDG